MYHPLHRPLVPLQPLPPRLLGLPADDSFQLGQEPSLGATGGILEEQEEEEGFLSDLLKPEPVLEGGVKKRTITFAASPRMFKSPLRNKGPAFSQVLEVFLQMHWLNLMLMLFKTLMLFDLSYSLMMIKVISFFSPLLVLMLQLLEALVLLLHGCHCGSNLDHWSNSEHLTKLSDLWSISLSF